MPQIAHLLRSTGRSEAAGYGSGDAVQTRHEEEGGKVVVERLTRSYGEVMNETEGVDTVHRREEDLAFGQVAVMF